MISSTSVTHAALDQFEKRLQAAVKMPDPPTKPGRWCAFQACKTICKWHTGPLIDIDELGSIPVLQGNPVYLESIRKILSLAPTAEALIKEARAQAQMLLANGTEVPGWKLVAKRGVRAWAADDHAIAEQMKLTDEQLYETTLRSPAQIEKLTRKKVPPTLAPMVSSGTTLAPEGDKRPAISVGPNEISKLMLEIMPKDE